MKDERTQPAAITFDVYGTLVQFHEAVEQVLSSVIAELGADVAMLELKAEFRATQGPLQQSAVWLPYNEILRRGLAMALQQRGLPYRSEHGERLVSAIAEARPFPEVPATLAFTTTSSLRAPSAFAASGSIAGASAATRASGRTRSCPISRGCPLSSGSSRPTGC